MTTPILQALAQDGLVDITTTGRSSGRPHRIETGLYRAGDTLYLSGLPGRRDWFANLKANPRFTLHLKQSTAANLSAVGTPVTDGAQRRSILSVILEGIGRSSDLDAWAAGSPLVRIDLEGFEGVR